MIDTSLVFNYDLSGGGGGIEKLPRPSLDHLCKSVLGCEIKKSPGRCVHKAVATMKLVLAILKSLTSNFNGAQVTLLLMTC